MGKGDYTIVAEYFPVHQPGVTLTILINGGVSTSSGITRKYLGHSVHNDNTPAIFQVQKTTAAGTAEFLSVQFDFGEQGWRSGESTRLTPMWPGFDSELGSHVG